MFEVSFSQASRLNSFFFLFSALLRLVQWFVWASYRVRFVLSFLFAFPLMGKDGWGGNPVCWWLGLYVCFVCCLNEASCIRCYWWLGDAGSCVQVFSFLWVIIIWYSLGLVWRRQWQPTPVLLPGNSHGRRSLGRLQSLGLQRVRHDWATSLSLSTFMHWKRKWQPTPVFLPEKSQGQGSLVGCCLWGLTELDTTEAT